MKRMVLGGMVFGGSLVAGCLPGDIRPEPGHVYVSAEASDASVNGFTSDDGWQIRFEKLIVGLGNVQLAGDACNDYANASYDRLFNFTLPGAQKLGEVYGLGSCEIRFRLRGPSSDSILQNGVTSADFNFMRELVLPEGTTEAPTQGPPPRTAVYMRGAATRGDEARRFDWQFVARYTLTDCANVETGDKNTFLHLEGGDSLRPVISFHAEDLFRLGEDASSARTFDVFAFADADGDGNITMEELAQVVKISTDTVELVDAGFADLFAAFVLPRMLHYDGNPCAMFVEQGRGGPGPF